MTEINFELKPQQKKNFYNINLKASVEVELNPIPVERHYENTDSWELYGFITDQLTQIANIVPDAYQEDYNEYSDCICALAKELVKYNEYLIQRLHRSENERFK